MRNSIPYRIERLHDEIENLKKLLEERNRHIRKLEREIERLRGLGAAQATEADTRLVELLSQRDAEIERLRAKIDPLKMGNMRR